jgi:hypothetical protein
LSSAAVETIMSVLAMISFVAAMAILGIWLLAFGVKLMGSHARLRPSVAGAGQRGSGDLGFRRLASDPHVFLFDRSLPAAAASASTARSARQSITSADEATRINLASPSRREVEIALIAPDPPPGVVAVVRWADESSDRRVLIPLSAGGAGPGTSAQPDGVALVPTTERVVGISRDVQFIQVADLGAYSASDISHSVRVAVGPTRRWWQELLDAAEAGRVMLPEATLTAIATGMSGH